MRATIYLEKTKGQIQRLLSLEDRDFMSPSYGCFDRHYWGWKFKDFPDATLQRATYSLAFAYAHSFPGNPYFRNDELAEWIRAGLAYWVRIQHSSGAFDQAFPNESSFGATAFTLLAQSETWLLLGENFFSP